MIEYKGYVFIEYFEDYHAQWLFQNVDGEFELRWVR